MRIGPRGPEPGDRPPLAIFAVTLVVVLAAGVPRPLAHDTHADGNPANDWIQKLRNLRGESCCGTDDCLPLTPDAIVALDDGSYRAQVGGTWFDVPGHAIMRDTSPDGQPWVCPWRKEVPLGSRNFVPGGVRCLLFPMLS